MKVKSWIVILLIGLVVSISANVYLYKKYALYEFDIAKTEITKVVLLKPGETLDKVILKNKPTNWKEINFKKNLPTNSNKGDNDKLFLVVYRLNSVKGVKSLSYLYFEKTRKQIISDMNADSTIIDTTEPKE